MLRRGNNRVKRRLGGFAPEPFPRPPPLVEWDAAQLDTPYKGEQYAITILEDKRTGRIAAETIEVRNGPDGQGVLCQTRTEEFEYNVDIDEGLFSLKTPADAVIVQQEEKK